MHRRLTLFSLILNTFRHMLYKKNQYITNLEMDEIMPVQQ